MTTHADHRWEASGPDRTSKHEYVQERILALIDELSPGDPIPSEHVLCQRFGVSRMTLRRAVDEIVRDGRLMRRQGSGTYVTRPKLDQPLTMTSFSEDMRRRGMVPTSQVMSMLRMPAGPRVAGNLEISPADEVVRLTRLRLADGEPMAIETVYLPVHLVPGLSHDDVDQRSLYELLASQYGITLGSATQTIETTATNEDESEVLRVALRSPAFLFRRTTRTTTDQVVETSRVIQRGDRYTITTSLQIPGR